jgi:hypothetical protein
MNTDKLPTHPYIHCSTTDCTTKTTCFGNNLQAKITLFGSVEKLLSGFKCQKCRQGVKLPKQKIIKKIRNTKKQIRSEIVASMIRSMPVYKPTTRQVGYLKDSPALIIETSKQSGCLRPDIFLDCNKVCDECPYNQLCLARNKTFSKYYLAPV